MTFVLKETLNVRFLFRGGLTDKFYPNRFLKNRFLLAGFYGIFTLKSARYVSSTFFSSNSHMQAYKKTMMNFCVPGEAERGILSTSGWLKIFAVDYNDKCPISHRPLHSGDRELHKCPWGMVGAANGGTITEKCQIYKQATERGSDIRTLQDNYLSTQLGQRPICKRTAGSKVLLPSSQPSGGYSRVQVTGMIKGFLFCFVLFCFFLGGGRLNFSIPGFYWVGKFGKIFFWVA